MKTTIILVIIVVLSQSFVLFTGGNSWDRSGNHVSNQGYSFQKLPAVFDTYFYSGTASTFDLSMFIKSDKNIRYSIKLNNANQGQARNVTSSSELTQVNVGKFTSKVGYNKITIYIVGNKVTSGLVSKFDVKGDFKDLTYITDSQWFYWGRRGPSGHFWMKGIQSSQVKYVYSEIRVPIGQDPVGSYWVANGFGQGYFGFQVNSLTERTVLFSVWSGYHTNDPKEIPAQYVVKLNKAGPGVKTGQFGNEGSGGQSYLTFNWTTGQTYKFLLKAEPLQTDATTYTAWFGDSSNATTGGWRLIASWTRPKIKTYVTGWYHFIQSFLPNYGNITRTAQYKNQRYYDESNTWKEVTHGQFTKDSTATDNQRRDVQGGVLSNGNRRNSFFLRNCGFFSTTTPYGTTFIRKPVGGQFSIDFANLP